MEITKNGLTYVPSTGEFYRKTQKSDVGTLVKGALYIRYKNRRVPAHRVAWEMFHGPIPEGLYVTPINGDKLDLKITNLTLVTREKLHSIAKFKHDLIKRGLLN